jgi:hypothetical protein
MVFTSIEIIAGVFAVVALIKIFTIIINKKIWFNYIVKPIYGNPSTSSVVFGILSLVILYYLLKELTVTQIFATVAFSSMLIVFGLLTFAKDLMPSLTKIYKEKFNLSAWVQTIFWMILSAWVLYGIFT